MDEKKHNTPLPYSASGPGVTGPPGHPGVFCHPMGENAYDSTAQSCAGKQQCFAGLLLEQSDMVKRLNENLNDLLAQIGGPPPSTDANGAAPPSNGMLSLMAENRDGIKNAQRLVDKLSCYISG